MSQYLFGIDLGGTTVKMGLFHVDGAMLDKWEIPTRRERGGAHILPDIADSMHQALLRRSIRPEALLGVGLGVPGAVAAGRFVERCVNLNGWGGFDVSRQLSLLCGCQTVRVVNDANAAALGELWQGGGQGCSSMVLITLGTGVGSGIVINGKLLTGAHGAGGEIGHIKIGGDADTDCGCGKRGCLEQYASATGIVHQARLLLARENTPSSLRGLAGLTAKDVLDQAKAGDGLARRTAERFGDSLGRALAAVSCVCDPEVFVIGGGVSRAGSFILDLIQTAFQQYAFPVAESTRFALAALGNDAGIYGAARLLLS